MPETLEIPEKNFYKISEVCRYADTQPYVLSFWESEFPQLNPEKTRGGQSLYKRQDLDLVLRIKHLLYQEEFTIAGARQRLEQELEGRPVGDEPTGDPEPEPADRRAEPAEETDFVAQATGGQEPLVFDSVSRERYEDAVDEISHLRLQLQEAQARCRKAESASQKQEDSARRHRDRAQKAVFCLEQVLDVFGANPTTPSE